MARGVKEDLDYIHPYKVADGSTHYQVRLRVHGKKISKAFDDLDDAQDWRDDVLRKRRRDQARQREGLEPEFKPQPGRRGGSSSAEPRTVASFLREEWWDVALKPRMPQRTRDDYQRHFKNWITPSELASLKPEEVTQQDVIAWQDWCRGKGASPDTIRTAQKVLSGAFSWAAKRSDQTGIRANPVAGVGWPRVRRQHEVRYFDFEITEFLRQHILGFSPGAEHERRSNALLFSVMQGTGMRPSEARQLEVAHIDEGFIELPAHLSKTNKKRVMPLWATTRDEIATFIDDHDLGPSDPLFAGEDEGAMSFAEWEQWRNHCYTPARKALYRLQGARKRSGARKASPDKHILSARAYDVCRHRYASAQLAALMPVTDLAQVMGHSVEMLSSTYARPLAQAREAVRGKREPLDPELELEKARAKVEQELADPEVKEFLLRLLEDE